MESLLGSKRIATALTWLVLMLFVALLATGWWYLLLPSIGIWPAVALITFGLSLLAVLAARQIGQLRAEGILGDTPTRWYNGWKPYLFLAVISALGTLNAAFVLFESRAILRDDIQNVRSSYGRLRDQAHRDLPPPGYSEKVARVNGLLKNLHEEIVNPNPDYCGVGASARAIITDLSRLIPGYRLINGSVPIRPCDRNRAETMFKSYADMAGEMVKGDGDFLKMNGPAKLSFLDALDIRVASAAKELNGLEVAASGLGTTDFLNKRALYDAKNNYNSDRSTFFSLKGSAVEQLPEISRLQSDDVSSYASTLRLFWDRLFTWRTLFYLLLAVALDFALIYLITQLNVRFGKKRKVRRVAGADTFRFQTDPKFLWTNPRQA